MLGSLLERYFTAFLAPTVSMPVMQAIGFEWTTTAWALFQAAAYIPCAIVLAHYRSEYVKGA